ncbi:MAG: single-stranded DNA-binding protein [Clostridiales bacterium]|jgi:single-strand DNA-binding protein|nr:single-stranded DNA-binding protein [Clostridiales bacterium]
MLNVVCLMGRLVADPELRHTQNQIPVTSFRIAVDRTYQTKGQERQADFLDIVAWRNTAEFVCRYFRKGQLVAIQGSIQTRKYTDKDGNNRTAFEIVADNAFFAEPKRDGASSGPRYDSQVPQFNEAAPAFSTAGAGDFEEIVSDDDLPF